jgi:Putative peptidoglycan binding domain
VLVLLAAVGVAVADPFSGQAASHNSTLDNGSPTSTSRVERTSLASQTQVSGTLGYAGSWTVSIPSGTPPNAVSQAEQTVTSARSQLATAQAGLSGDESTLARARSTLATDKATRNTACHGNASTAAGCGAAKQTVSQDEASVATARQKIAADRPQLASARAGLAAAEQALVSAQASAASYGSNSSYTKLPSPGAVIRRGRPLFSVDGQPTLLLYGTTPAWRAFRAGMSPGADVAELNANLRALGYIAPSGDAFTSATSAAISSLQQAHRLAATGSLGLGAVLFEPGAFRIATVTPTVGTPVQPGPVLTGTSTRPNVSVQLDAAQQSEVKVGDRVNVVLPDSSTTPGVVSAVGKVATVPSADQQANGGSGSPTIDVDVRLLHTRAAGHLDQAPVEVSITEQSVHNVLAVPVNALVALAGGGYAVEEVEADGTHQLVAVTPGLFDDAQGLVQVSGNGLAPGQRIVVPAS